MTRMPVRFTLNGQDTLVEVEPRALLSDVIRHDLRLTGTHVACENGVCGSCTVQVDGEPVRSCLMLAVQAEGCEVRTVESLATADGRGGLRLHHIQRALHEKHGLQCGFCTPGLLMTLSAWLPRNPSPTEDEIREVLSGHLCRCTGYVNIIAAVKHALALAAEEA